MGSACHKNEILKAIIAWIAINMMYNFICGNRSIQMFRHNKMRLSYITILFSVGVIWFKKKYIAITVDFFATFPTMIICPSELMSWHKCICNVILKTFSVNNCATATATNPRWVRWLHHAFVLAFRRAVNAILLCILVFLIAPLANMFKRTLFPVLVKAFGGTINTVSFSMSEVFKTIFTYMFKHNPPYQYIIYRGDYV